MKGKSMIERHDIIELARHLRREHLFICSERKNMVDLNEKVVERSQRLFHLSWIIGKQKLNLEKLAGCGNDRNPGEFCLRATSLDNVVFIDSYKKLLSANTAFAELFLGLRKSPETVAQILLEAEKNAIPNLSTVISIIMSSFYCDCLLPEDRSYVLSLLQQLIYHQIGTGDNPRRLLRHGSCAFSQVYKIFSESLREAKLFLIAALREPAMLLLMEDDLFLDIDPERAVTRFSRDERLRHFGQEGTPDYVSNLKKYREWTIDKLVNLATKFIQGINSSVYGFPDSLCWLIRQLYSSLMGREQNPMDAKEIGVICSDLIFTHFICHAIVNPEVYGIVDTHINHISRFNLMQIAKIIHILGINRWENVVEHKYKDLYSRFPQDCISSILDLIVQGNLQEHTPGLYKSTIEVSRTCALITEQDLYQLMNFLFQVSYTCKNQETRSTLASLLSKIPETQLSKLATQCESVPSTSTASLGGDELNLNESIKSKKGLLNRVTRRRPEGDQTNGLNLTGDSVVSQASKGSSNFAKIEVLVLNFPNIRSSQSHGLLSEEKVLAYEQQRRHTKVRMNLETGSAPNEETESVVSSSVVSDVAVEKRKRFSLSQDQESIGTSDNLEAISEAASNHSVSSSLDLENENENDNDNLSDMVSANVSSGRGTPNVSGRDTPSSNSSHSKNSSDDETEDASQANNPKPPTNNAPSNRPSLRSATSAKPSKMPNRNDEIEEKFGKFDCKQTTSGDETKSIISDTWSTDVLASDSEALEQVEGAAAAVPLASGFNYMSANPSPGSQGMFSAFDRSETVSQADDAWSTDVLYSDTERSDMERLHDFELDEAASVGPSEDIAAASEVELNEEACAGAEGGSNVTEPKFMFFEDDVTKAGTIKHIHRLASNEPSNNISSDRIDVKPTGQNENSSSYSQSKMQDGGGEEDDTFLANSEEGTTAVFHRNQPPLVKFQTLGKLSFDVKKMPLTEEERVIYLCALAGEKDGKQPNSLEKDGAQRPRSSITELLSIEFAPKDSTIEGNRNSSSQESLIDFDKEINNTEDSSVATMKSEDTRAAETTDFLTGDRLSIGPTDESRSSYASASSGSITESTGETSESLLGDKQKASGPEKRDSDRSPVPDVLLASTGAIPKRAVNSNSNKIIPRRGKLEDEAPRGKKGFFKLPNLKTTLEKVKSFKDKRLSSSINEINSANEIYGNGLMGNEPPLRQSNESTDEILEKYRDKRAPHPGGAAAATTTAIKQNMGSNLVSRASSSQETPVSVVNNLVDESVAFENTKKILRHVLSLVDIQMLPNAINTPARSVSNERHHIELILFLKTLLAEADYMNNSSHMVALQEAIRCIQSFDEKSCQKLFWSLREDYQRRSTYIAYLINCRQDLLSTIAQFDGILDHLKQDREICNHNLVNMCVRFYLESKEKYLKKFIEKFQKLDVSDEKAQLVEKFLLYLFKGMENDSVWQMASEEQVEHGKELVERYIMSQIYIFALYPNGDGDVLRDRILQQHIEKLSNVITPDHKDLRIPNIYHSECPWPAAQRQIVTINAYKTPREKVTCVVKCCKIIMSLLTLANDKSVPTADDLIPVLVFILIKANPSSLLSNVQYVSCFYEKQLDGEEAYWWIQFCSAVEFVKTMDYA